MEKIVLEDHFKERLACLEKLLAFWKSQEDYPEKRNQVKTLEENIKINKQLIGYIDETI